MNRKQKKWKTEKMDTIEFALWMESVMDVGMKEYGDFWCKAKTRHKHIIEHTPFEDMNEVRDWHAFCGHDLELQLAEGRRGTPEERVYMFQVSGSELRH